ncbi:MAG TPA: hypothetical protein VEI81_02475 [Methanoregula sp.]|nr:hypothetical protein [Methanoregula sp.]
MQPDQKLVFVYNLDKGSLSDIKDKLYATVPAKSPACKLCELIQTPVGMKKGWKRFIQELGIPADYLFREEFSKEFSLPKFSAPGIFLQLGSSLIPLISAEEINRCGTTDDLIEMVKQRVRKFQE